MNDEPFYKVGLPRKKLVLSKTGMHCSTSPSSIFWVF